MPPFPAYPAPIPDGAIDLSPQPPEFQQSFSDTVGNAATDSDGFEQLFSILTSHLDDSGGFLAGLDSSLTDVGMYATNFDIPIEQNAFADLQTGIQTGQPAIDGFNAKAVTSKGRVWPGSIQTALSVQTYLGFRTAPPGKTILIDRKPNYFTGPPFEQQEILQGDAPFPVRWGIHIDENWILYNPPVTGIDIEPSVPVIESVYSDAFSSIYLGEVWNIYFDINPVVAGTWDFTLHIHTGRSTSNIGFRAIVQPPLAPSGGGGPGGGGRGPRNP